MLTRRDAALGLAAGVVVAGPLYRIMFNGVDATDPAPDDSPPVPVGPGWKVLPVGAGGFVTGIQFDASGKAAVIRTDVGGAYVGEAPDFRWRQLITPSSLPDPATDYYGERHPAGEGGYTDQGGVYAVAIAPSDSDRIYVTWQGFVFTSVDKGRKLTRTSLPRTKALANTGDARLYGPKMVVDPHNPNVAYFGGMTTGIWRTLDGGANWTQVSRVTPNASSDEGRWAVLCIDHTSPLVAGRKSKVYFASNGSGFHGSSDGGSSFNMLDAGISGVSHIVCDAVGAIYCSSSGVLKRFEAGAFKTLSTPFSGHTVAVDPFNNNRIIYMSIDAFAVVSLDRGVTWSDARSAGTNVQNEWGWDLVADDIPWLGKTTTTNPSRILFRPGVANELWMSMGVGVVRTNFPNGSLARNRLVYRSVSAGIEELVAHWIVSPPGGAIVLCSWDRPLFRIGSPGRYPTTYGPDFQLRHAASADYASDDTSKLAALVSHFPANPAQYSATSADGGKRWTRMSNQPMTGIEGGSLAMNETGNIVVFPAMNGPPKFTLDGGATPWKPIVFPTPIPSGDTGFGFGNMSHNRQIAAADKTVPGTFYVYNYGPANAPALRGLWKSADKGVTWFRVNSTAIAAFATYHSTLRCVFGKTGHLLFAAGDVGGPNNPAPTEFMFSSDGGVSFEAISGFKEVKYFDLGRAASASAYPAIYVLGYYRGAFGFYRCIDFNPSTRTGMWTNLGLPDSVDTATCVGADKNTYGRVYMGFVGTGYHYGNFA